MSGGGAGDGERGVRHTTGGLRSTICQGRAIFYGSSAWQAQSVSTLGQVPKIAKLPPFG